jgi:hypothetical protein
MIIVGVIDIIIIVIDIIIIDIAIVSVIVISIGVTVVIGVIVIAIVIVVACGAHDRKPITIFRARLHATKSPQLPVSRSSASRKSNIDIAFIDAAKSRLQLVIASFEFCSHAAIAATSH